VSTQALLMEILLAGFFAVACFRARAESESSLQLAPRRLLVLTNRVERMRRSRWQWFAMVLLLVVIRLQQGTPLAAELTVIVQFLVFLALPAQKNGLEVAQPR